MGAGGIPAPGSASAGPSQDPRRPHAGSASGCAFAPSALPAGSAAVPAGCALPVEGMDAARPAPGLFTLCPLPPWLPHLRRVPLQSRQEPFQGGPALVVDKGDDSGGMSLHQALPLPRHLLLQGLQNGLEVLMKGWAQVRRGEEGQRQGQRQSGRKGYRTCSGSRPGKVNLGVGLDYRRLTGRVGL